MTTQPNSAASPVSGSFKDTYRISKLELFTLVMTAARRAKDNIHPSRGIAQKGREDDKEIITVRKEEEEK
jgi:hypothetical protein